MSEGLNGFCIGVILSGVVVSIVCYGIIDEVWKKNSVKAGKAEYYLDTNHNKQWRWKE